MDFVLSDALILIHLSCVNRERYCNNIKRYAAYYMEQNRPVFLLNTNTASQNLMDGIKYYAIPEGTSGQKQVDFMVEIINKPYDEINVIFGGAFTEICVVGNARKWCTHITTSESYWGVHDNAANKKMFSGAIIGDISRPLIIY